MAEHHVTVTREPVLGLFLLQISGGILVFSHSLSALIRSEMSWGAYHVLGRLPQGAAWFRAEDSRLECMACHCPPGDLGRVTPLLLFPFQPCAWSVPAANSLRLSLRAAHRAWHSGTELRLGSWLRLQFPRCFVQGCLQPSARRSGYSPAWPLQLLRARSLGVHIQTALSSLLVCCLASAPSVMQSPVRFCFCRGFIRPCQVRGWY